MLRLKEETKEYLTKEMGGVHDAFKILDGYNPMLVDTLASLRKLAVTGSEGTSAISKKYRELIMIAVEVATGRGERGRSHARKAIWAGATPNEILEVLALCIYLVGMSSWVDGGRDCLLSAEDEAKKMKQGERFVWSDKVESNKDGKRKD